MRLDFLSRGDALLLVDVQNDFCPGGALAVPGGDEVIPVLNRWIRAAEEAGIPVYASRDWHPENHVSFTGRGGPWPPHCVRGTRGAEFHPGLEIPGGLFVINKATDPDRDAYSAFDGTGLAARLHRSGVRRLFVGGLATDYCVKATVLDALREGFTVHVITDGIRAVEVKEGDGRRALDEMSEAGAVLAESP